MPTIKNMSYAAIPIKISAEKTINLDYGKTVKVTDAEAKSAAVKKLVREEKVKLIPDVKK